MRTRVLVVFALAGSVSTVAAAHEDGINGYSGKSGTFCNQCHSGGSTPTVKLAGPATLQAGASGTYTFTISGGAGVAGGLDAALDAASIGAGATLAVVSPTTQLLAGEITHQQPTNFSSGTLSFQFAVVAPATAATMTLYVAGNSTNHNGSDSGDKAAATTMSITVDGPAPAGADLSTVTIPPAAASDLGVAPTPSGRDMTTPAGDPGFAGPPAGDPSSGAKAQGGCSLAPTRAPAAGAAWLLGVFAIFALARRRTGDRQ